MREPFSGLLGRDERLLAAGEVDLAVTTGPLAVPAELLALFSPALSVILFLRLDGAVARALGALLPPLVIVLLAWFPLRRWRRPREWLGVTERRLLRWWRPAALFAGPRIEEIPRAGAVGVELDQDDRDRRAGSHQVILHYEGRARSLGRVHNAERLHDAIVAAVSAASRHGGTDQAAATPAAPPTPAPLPGDFIPPAAPPADYRS